MELLGCLSDDGFDSYYSEFLAVGIITARERKYSAVKCALIERLKTKKSPEKAIHLEISDSQTASKLIDSLSEVENLYHNADFNDEAKFGLLKKTMVWIIETSPDC